MVAMRSPLLPSRSSILIPRRFGSENNIIMVTRVLADSVRDKSKGGQRGGC